MLASRLRRAMMRSSRHGAVTARFISKKPWVPVQEDMLQEYTVKALTWEMEQFQRKSAERTVPWYLNNLPIQYFEEITPDIQRDHLRALTALSEAGLASNTEEEITKLNEFCSKGNLDRVKYLTSLGADPNQGDYDGRTPFHLAAAEGHLEVLQYLCSLPNADWNQMDRWANTPLNDAEIAENANIVEFLKSFGTDASRAHTASVMHDAGKPAGMDLMIKSRNQQYVSFFNNDFTPSAFRGLVEQLNPDRQVQRAKAFVALDDSLQVSVFEYGGSGRTEDFTTSDVLHDPESPAHDIYEFNESHGLGYSREFLFDHMLSCPYSYLKFTPPKAYFDQLGMMNEVIESQYTRSVGKMVFNSLSDEGNTYWAYLCSPQVFSQSEMSRFMDFFGVEGFQIVRFHMDQMGAEDGQLVLSRALLIPPEGMEMTNEKMEELESNLRRLKFLDDHVFQWYEMCHPQWSLIECEVLHCLANLVFGPLNKDLPHAFTLDRLRDNLCMEEHRGLSKQIADLFMAKFDPNNRLSKTEFNQRVEYIREQIDKNIQTNIWQRMFHKMVDAVEGTLRTNLHLKNRMCLMSRIDPELMMSKTENDRLRPYGVFFGHGRRFNGFHCRFREIARGGLRVVPAMSAEQFGLESTRHFDEVYGLSYAQQLKNKDIPEGGSKAVILCDASHRTTPGADFIVRASIKYFGDSILDLITPDEEIRSQLVDYWGQPELLYLGPDENIIPSDINWLVDRAATRGMKYPAAFMSSKPEAGINHKVYGVTSEGVAVFLHQSLLESGINPDTDTFTVKLTGGPNGDVAGNMIKIFRRDYGAHIVKIVGMSDATGSVENPDGLDMEELYRLHIEDLPIEAYNPDFLNGGELNLVNTPEGIQKRNTMHNRLVADVFVPAGGRPNTINALNWKNYLQADGTPSAPIIVEAANIFTTPDARRHLGENGVKIVKDSSANKAGVCCSSYEIVASMLLSKEEFLAHKAEIVEDVLVRLREIARLEAAQLFRESKANPSIQMPDIAVNISAAIERATDLFDKILSREFDSLDVDTRRRLMVDSLPKKIVELADERLNDLPLAYIRAMVASSLASKLVYLEGTDFVNQMDDVRLVDVATKYVKTRDHVANCLSVLDESNLSDENRMEIRRIVELYGVRATLDNL